jgi:hypothetical protein
MGPVPCGREEAMTDHWTRRVKRHVLYANAIDVISAAIFNHAHTLPPLRHARDMARWHRRALRLNRFWNHAYDVFEAKRKVTA